MKNVLIKVSGDMFTNPKFIDFVKHESDYGFVVVVIGGGTQINERFIELGYQVEYNEYGRVSNSFEQRQVAREVLEENQNTLVKIFKEAGVNAIVEIPFIKVGTVLCPINGDEMVRASHKGFSECYIITTPDRVSKKQAQFDIENISIVGL